MNYRVYLAVGALSLSIASLGMAADKEDHKALEKEFAKTLTGATLVGRFTVDGRSDTGKTNADRYEIEKAEKVAGHRWIITARIKYGTHDVKMPVPLEVFWAGDTPVMIYGDRYAGTWQHDKFGGHMWGKIEHGEKSEPADAKK
jgi:hypothetical protein